MVRWLVALLLLVSIAHAEERKADVFRPALAGYKFQFPRDHGSHPDFRTEWWYFTGNVASAEGRDFGYKLTIFRTAIAPGGEEHQALSPMEAGQLYICHFAVSDKDNKEHESWEWIGRPGFGQAAASTTTLDVRLKTAHIRMDDAGVIHLKGSREHAAIDLKLTPAKPFVIHGENGVHQKADIDGQASHYISFTRLNAEGTVTWRDKAHTVKGLGWMDHEFGSDYLSNDQAGWDWFAIQLESGHDLMVYQLRNKDGSANRHSIGSIVAPDGTMTKIKGTAFTIESTSTWKSPESGGVYPMGWVIRMPGEKAELKVIPVFAEQEMAPKDYTGTWYWEGAVRIEGTFRGEKAAGQGYVELVGYAGEFDLL